MRACLLSFLLLAGCDDTRGMPRDDAGPPSADAGMNDGGNTDVDAALPPPSPLVDPSCIDGMYTEALPTSSADISDLVAGYSSASVETFVLDVLDRRYPIGRALTAGGNTAGGGCITRFLGDTSSADAVIGDLGTVVHECGHFYDNSMGGSDSAYVINETLTFVCAGGNSPSLGGLTFERSRIISDEYQTARTPCGGTFQLGCDFYADIYLDGDPDNGTFEGGDQGYNMLLEEAVQYVNSLATALAFTNELAGPGSGSHRDGILTFLWYVMRYLRMARLQFPSAYAHILTGDGGCWREATLTLWGRAWLYLQATEGMDHLGIEDAALMSLVTTPDLLAEIQRLRDAAGCTP